MGGHHDGQKVGITIVIFLTNRDVRKKNRKVIGFGLFELSIFFEELFVPSKTEDSHDEDDDDDHVQENNDLSGLSSGIFCWFADLDELLLAISETHNFRRAVEGFALLSALDLLDTFSVEHG